MDKTLSRKAERFGAKRRRKKGWQRVVTTLSVVVVFCTIYALILPAITMDQDAACGIEAHSHTDGCYAPITDESTGETVLTLSCQLPEHVHEDACYPLEDGEQHSRYLCGYGEHSHGDGCTDESGGLTCTVPAHIHEAACLVADLDLNADVEQAEHWQAIADGAGFNGIWTEDVLRMAMSQMGYCESTRNCVLTDGELKGYTRYGGWIGTPYGDWAAAFAAFCLSWAEVENMPVSGDSAAWVAELTASGQYRAAGEYVPRPGDLIFFDYDREDGVPANWVGIVAQLDYAEDGTLTHIRTVEGDLEGKVGGVVYEATDPTVAGYGVIPDNPLSQEEWRAANEVAELAAGLPDAAALEEAFRTLNADGDRLGFEALRQEVVSRIEEILTRYETFNDLQRSRVGSLEHLPGLQEICGGIQWKDLPALTDDGAVVSGLTAGSGEILRQEEQSAGIRTDSVLPGDTVRWSITVDTESYYSDVKYGQARVKLELVLPVGEDKAAFEPDSILWLEEACLTLEQRTINGTETVCQVLTGYRTLAADETTSVAVPGSFTECISVKVGSMDHGEKLAVIVSAAMEHGTWNGPCEIHGIEERLTVVTGSVILYCPLSAEEQQATFDGFRAEIDAMTESGERSELDSFRNRIFECYCAGALNDEQYAWLHQAALELSGVDVEDIAEPSVGDGWLWMDFEGDFYTENEMLLTSAVVVEETPLLSAMPADLYSNLGLDSGSQIYYGGGENSADDMIWVSKTIEGTEQENVFDITLQIITKDEINEIYKEPNMAVVIVMDISNTMTSIFSGETTVTRYNAAMDAAEQFMKSFAEETDGISKLGYVAFNTHAHQVFAMQECSTASQAASLAKTMRSETQSIMNKAARNSDKGTYASSHDRFTNIEAGLKMGADMLNGVDNEHKYIIFLSDGFPTTYLTASTTDGYTGYDPYTASGTLGKDGVFADKVMSDSAGYTIHCDYGTSYSDTAAIKARELAVSLKNAGVNIFSIGVDVEGQTIHSYHWDSVNRLKTVSTVERRKSAAYYNSTGYEIGTLHSEILVKNPTAKQFESMAQDFKDWLKGSKTTGIGSGYYYESTDQDGLMEAYENIFAQIVELNAASAHLDWVATDPMPDMGVHELETMEFIGFWDENDVLQGTAISGVSKDNNLYDNSATFDTESSTISWDIKNSGYVSTSLGNNKNYLTSLRYRVRLKNENTGFVEGQIYDTNDTTFLNYRVIEVKNGTTTISDRKRIDFPIPEVFGYLSELNFKKVNASGVGLEGAEFALTHDPKACGTCRGDGTGHVALPVYTAVSGADGMVTFTAIPSGHHYVLTETKAPPGYIIAGNTYKVVVSYDALTVTVTDSNGQNVTWNNEIFNDAYYELPNTGGRGAESIRTAGMLMITAAALLLPLAVLGRKRQKAVRSNR